MSSEIEVPETPNWLQELEAKREKRLKAKLGHETGAGAPCLKCGDKCPGLDLHFWRKCCKICRCSKEEHEVQDDDIYGWAQFQLLGNKPSKIKRKIVLPGKNNELELDWAPKGNADVVDKYLKTLPPELLPVKGSQAAQDRKQQLQKQIPVHDIDPTLCHELSEDELNKMNEYITHVKKSSVGVGQIVNLSSIIKGNLHMLNPNDAALVANRYPKGIPLSEIVTLHPVGKVDPLKHHNLTQNMKNMAIKESGMKNLSPNNLISREETMSPITINKIHDINYAGYTNEMSKLPHQPQFSNSINKVPNYLNDPTSEHFGGNNYPYQEESSKINSKNDSRPSGNHYQQNPSGFINPKYTPSKTNNDNDYNIDPNLNERFMPNSNFNPKNLPSQFINQHMPLRQNIPVQLHNEQPYGTNVPYSEINSTGSAFVPYSKTNTNLNVGYQFSKENPTPIPNVFTNLNSVGKTVDQFHPSAGTTDGEWEKTNELRKDPQQMHNYLPGKYNQSAELQSPLHVPRNVKDLAFSTYEAKNLSDPKNREDHEGKINNENMQDTPCKGHNQNKPTSMVPGAYPQSSPKSLSVPNYSASKPTGYGSQDKKISNVQPGNFSVSEDFLEPSQVFIGAIQDINYPEIKAALHGTNDFYEDYSPDSIKEILNNIKLPDCHYCKKPFEEKEFAVTIERANVLFHAACFKCAGCNQNLADNLYFYSKENNNIYCGRDYAKIRGIPRCKACDELIFTKEYCLAEDNTFHLKHFCCTECDTPLAGQDYIVDDGDGMPYCLPCFERSKADSCNSCGSIIKPDETGCNLNGVHFHADDHCFACKICHKPLIGQKLLLRNKTLYCSHECYGVAQ